MFKVGDKVVHINDPEYKGVVTKIHNVPQKGFSKPYQFLWLDDSKIPCGCTNEYFKLDND